MDYDFNIVFKYNKYAIDAVLASIVLRETLFGLELKSSWDQFGAGGRFQLIPTSFERFHFRVCVIFVGIKYERIEMN